MALLWEVFSSFAMHSDWRRQSWEFIDELGCRVQAVDGSIRKSTLENGLRVITQGLPGVRSTALGVLVDVGSANEPDHLAGISHLCEHLVFQGTSNRSALEISRLMDGAGGRVGGFTTRDYTCYFALVLGDYLTYAVDLLGDLLLNPVFPEDALAHQKGAVLCEIEAAADSPSALCHDLMKAIAWPDHPLGRPLTGTARTVGAIGREDLIYFLHDHYLPNRIIVSAAGALDHDDVVACVRDAFWRLLGERPPQPAPSLAVVQSGVRLRTHGGSQAYFSLAFEAPAYTAPERYMMHALAQVFGGGLSSRLFRSLREEQGWVFDVSASYQAYRDGGLFVVEGSTVPENLMPVLGRIYDSIEGLASWTEPIDADEMARFKTQLKAQILLAGEDTHSVMSRLATQELYFGHFETEIQTLVHLESIDEQSMERFLGPLLEAGLPRPALAVVAPDRPSCYDQNALEAFVAERRGNFSVKNQGQEHPPAVASIQ